MVFGGVHNFEEFLWGIGVEDGNVGGELADDGVLADDEFWVKVLDVLLVAEYLPDLVQDVLDPGQLCLRNDLR